MTRDAHSHPDARRLRWSAWLFGFGLGGFFDGILLHQVLQWHHLLSGVRSGALADLRVQVMADGAFHGLMYVLVAVGLVLALRGRAALGAARAGRRFAAGFLIGFGAWHLADALLSHWLLGLHRIRTDAGDPLLWNLGWLSVFGLLPLLAGWSMKRRGGGGGGIVDADRPRAATLPLALMAATVLAGLQSARPASAAGEPAMVSVVMRPGAPAGALLSALDGDDARVVWADPAGGVLVLRLQDAGTGRLLRLYGAGALYVGGTLLPAGCSSWLRTTAAPAGAVIRPAPALPAGPAAAAPA